tara:strand:- start:510 stop:767 length:258 start_codon:yes stop_codon:yes gene_type:complete
MNADDDLEGMNPDTVKAMGKLDNLNQLFKEGATATIIDVDSSVYIAVGNSRYYFNPVVIKEEYEGMDGETHLRTILSYDGWEKSL